MSDEEEWTEALSASYLDSPFRGAARDTGRGSVDAHSEAVRELLAELYSDEMEEALSELLEETAALHAEHSAALVGATASEAAEQPVREHLEALAEQAERYLEALAEAAGEADTRSLTEAELESVFESVAPPAGVGESPAFEQFLGALKNFAKKAVSGAVNLAKKGVQAVKTGVKAVAKVMPIGVILRQLRPIVQPLLMRVLKIAIGRLPAPVRPIATQLARKLLREAPMTEAEETEEAASADRAPAAEALGAEPAPAALLSLELAGATAGLLLTGDESEREAWAAEAAQSLSGGAAEAYGQQSPAAEAEALAEARERFTEAIGRLPDGGDPRPALEEFLPVVMAALPIVRKIVQIAGRQNVVGALSNLLAALIGKFTGPRNARILADAVADTGLKLLSMETAAEAPERLAASALAATAEDTVRQLAQLPAEELEDPVRLEVAAGKAFNVAAAANIPSTLLREDLAETEAPGVKGMWVPLPRGAKGALRYKKYSRVFEVEVGAEQAAALRTGGGTPLATVLRDQFRVRAFPVRLKIHLYEAGAHSWARQIQAAEQRGAGRAGARLLTLLPLTRQAADSLLGHPGLGMAKVPKVVKGRQLPRGVRLYGIELADRRQGAGGGAAAPGHPRRPTEVQLTVDARAGRESLAIALHLAEERAQDILRSAGTPPAVGPFLGSLGSALAEATVTALFGGESRNVRVFREAYEQSSHLSPADEGEEFVSSLPPRLRDAVAEGLKRAAGQAFAQYFKGRVDEFARALQDPRDGVTLVVTLPGAPLVGIVTGILARRLPSLPEVSRAVAALAAEPAAKVEVKAGRDRG
ncbi:MULTISPECIES: hypothetical protein [unclassified Streptomyces]|uniref:hypothetical protein n=1 Tax=unclassified Streptomyces TaxID=2593676 RepID=UPI0033E2798A